MTTENDTGETDDGVDTLLSEMEVSMMEFLDPSFNREAEPEDEDDSSDGDPASTEAEPGAALPESPAPTAPSKAPVAEPVAGNEPEADPALLSQFFTAPTEAAPATPVAQTPAPAPEPEAPKPWAPFQTPVVIPPALSEALFGDDSDTETRAAALGSIINGIGNGITQLVEQRFREQYAPMIRAQALQEFGAQTQVQSIDTDFYGAYPELAAHRDVVRKAFGIVAQAEPTATYNEQTRAKVGALARAALTRMGVQFTPTPAAPAATPKAPAKPKQPFVAGGARPGNFTPPDPNDPGALLDELSAF